MSKIFRSLLGFILLITTIGLATCQSLLKAEPNVQKFDMPIYHSMHYPTP